MKRQGIVSLTHGNQGGPFGLRTFLSGRYYVPESPVTLLSLDWGGGNNGACTFVPFYVGVEPVTFDRIAIEITGAGSAGAVYRLGIYAENPETGGVGDLILDAGTVAATSTGAAEIMIDQALSGLVYLACAVQGAAVTSPSVRSYNADVIGKQYAGNIGKPSAVLANYFNSYLAFQTGAFASTPAGFTSPVNPNIYGASVHMRAK